MDTGCTDWGPSPNVLQRVLELGCGCGVTGLVAARWARHVTLTDAEPEVTI